MLVGLLSLSVPNLNINGSDELTLRATDIDGFHRDVIMPIEIMAVNDTPEFITPLIWNMRRIRMHQ